MLYINRSTLSAAGITAVEELVLLLAAVAVLMVVLVLVAAAGCAETEADDARPVVVSGALSSNSF